jgi:hypothetical protein
MRNKKRTAVRMVRIHVNNNEELLQGAREVGAMLDELGAYLAQRRKTSVQCLPANGVDGSRSDRLLEV